MGFTKLITSYSGRRDETQAFQYIESILGDNKRIVDMDILFLGMNDIGEEIYDWLCNRDSISVKAIITEPEQLTLVKEVCPDAIVASGFTHIVPPEILEIPTEGCINLHPGYLPHTRGYFPNIWSIVDDLPPGATLHYMD